MDYQSKHKILKENLFADMVALTMEYMEYMEYVELYLTIKIDKFIAFYNQKKKISNGGVEFRGMSFIKQKIL